MLCLQSNIIFVCSLSSSLCYSLFTFEFFVLCRSSITFVLFMNVNYRSNSSRKEPLRGIWYDKSLMGSKFDGTIWHSITTTDPDLLSQLFYVCTLFYFLPAIILVSTMPLHPLITTMRHKPCHFQLALSVKRVFWFV